MTFAKQLLKMGIKGERCLMDNLNMNRQKAAELHENRMGNGITNSILPTQNGHTSWGWGVGD